MAKVLKLHALISNPDFQLIWEIFFRRCETTSYEYKQYKFSFHKEQLQVPIRVCTVAVTQLCE